MENLESVGSMGTAIPTCQNNIVDGKDGIATYQPNSPYYLADHLSSNQDFKTSTSDKIQNELERSKNALDTIKYCDDVEEIVETILTYEVNPKEFLEFVKKDSGAKSLVPKILKACKIIRERNPNAPSIHDQENKNAKIEPVEIDKETKDPENIFDNKSITPEQFELFRRTAWKQDYYFDDFNVELGKMHASKLEINKAKDKIRYLLMFIVRIIYDNGTAFVLLKTNRISKLAIMDYNNFRKYHEPYKHSFYKLTGLEEKVFTSTTKTGKVVTTSELMPTVFWCFEELTSKNYYTYFHYNWIPYSPSETDPTIGTITFNIYLGLKAKVLPQCNENIIKLVLSHIKEIYANNNEEYFTYIISWLAHLVQYPRKFLPFLLIMGPKRCGKSTFILWFIRYVMGLGECGTNVENLDSILSKFNSHIFRKLLVHIKELKGVSSDGHKSIYDKMELLKTKITDINGEMERKFIDRVNVDNYAKFIGCANDIPIRLSEDDKERWAVFWCSNRRLGDYTYFEEAKKIMADEDNIPLAQETADHFLTYLLCYKIPINLYKDIPITEKYQEIMSISIQQEQQFLNLLRSGDYQIEMPSGICETYSNENKEYYLAKKLQLYEFYLDYCRKFKISTAPKEIFWQRIKGLLQEYRDRRNGNNIWYYLIPKEWVSLYLQIHNNSGNEKIRSLLTTVEDPNFNSLANSVGSSSNSLSQPLSF